MIAPHQKRRARGHGNVPAVGRLRSQFPDPGALRSVQCPVDPRPGHVAPELNPENGHLSLPDLPGLGLDLNLEVVREHPYDPSSYFDANKEGWEKRLGTERKEP